ncbi:uncharacterized protein LOC122959722 [Acropora millepora]|uniref:uncharacterized protein LOC122959722 n=1 Tax=Acropora millepora TaxID=45264 RepID=UPI001CF51A4E|nr:uncharacterized protein LOC122959722 [Acropora millepora]
MTALTDSSDGRIKIWDVESGRNVRSINYPDRVSEIHCTPDGKAIITRSQNANTFDAWDMQTTRHLASFTADGSPNHVKFIGKRLALGIGENPNLMVPYLHRPYRNSEVLQPSPYDGLSMEVTLEDFQERPTANDSMDDDKDDDKSQIC